MENSLGELTLFGKRSLSGKIGLANNKYLIKDESRNWVFMKFRDWKSEKVFFPFSESAILKCKERAKKHFR